MNFDYLKKQEDFNDLYLFCSDAEKLTLNRPDLSVIQSRKALEYLIKMIYTLKFGYYPSSKSLFELVSSEDFTLFINNDATIASLHYIRKIGNRSAHSEKVTINEAKLCLENLYFFTGEILKLMNVIESYPEYDDSLLVKNDNSSVYEKAINISDEIFNKYNTNLQNKTLMSNIAISETETRKLFIDVYLKEAKWEVLNQKDLRLASKACIEIKVEGMPNSHNVGYIDYVLYGANGKPLAIIEAKKTSKSPIEGRQQAILYANCLEAVYNYRPVIYYTNGFQIWCIDGLGYPERIVFGFHNEKELNLIIQRQNRQMITDVKIDENITDRPYQKMAITSVCDHFNKMHRKGLLVMATGTGKTRVAISLVDVLQKNNWVKNVLFLADRTALVNQAYKNFKKLLPNTTCSKLTDSERDLNARILFSTYQTMINYIDDDEKEFGIARFDLIIIDEAHRSIFNKYKSIFTYFDSLLVGLTATPRSDVEASTYELFELEEGIPNFSYELSEAVNDQFLVNYEVINKTTKLMQRGIKYKDLSSEEKKQYEEKFEEEGFLPEEKSASEIFKKIYNKNTVDRVLNTLMTEGLRVDFGEKIGKTIIFAFNHVHAELIVKEFNILYPELNGYCQLIDNYVNYSQSIIDTFEIRNKLPQIAVSVDMLDTGVDVPDILNLVFFKEVYSKIKFLQMIGRGTRLSKDIFGAGKDKEKFYIFDFCGNFEYFGENPEGKELKPSKTLSQRLFEMKLETIYELQKYEHQSNKTHVELYLKFKQELINIVKSMNMNQILVRDNIKYITKYKIDDEWNHLSLVSINEIKKYIIPLIGTNGETDSYAKSFDLTIFALQLGYLCNTNYEKPMKHVIDICGLLLQEYLSIPQVKIKQKSLEETQTEEYWQTIDLSKLEKLRSDVRLLVKQLVTIPQIYDTSFSDEVINKDPITNSPIIVKSYKQKVIDYLIENTNNEVIKKITNLDKIDNNDLNELEKILWNELGTKEDYQKITNKDNLAVFIRSIVGVSQKVINEKFGSFLNDNVLNPMQQEFVKTMINYVRENGDITFEEIINVSPFDNYSIQDLFGEKVSIVKIVVETLHECVCI